MTDVKTLLKEAVQTLKSQSASPELDAQLLLAHVLEKPRAWLIAHDTDSIDRSHTTAFRALVTKRSQAMPLAYLTGQKEFWSLPLKINPHSLIPRPETELLVEITLKKLAGHPKAKLLELGCGSGAISLALAHERPDWQISAIERSPEALALAEENRIALDIKNVDFIASDWFSKLDAKIRFDAIVSNPPYIAQNDPHLTREAIRHEPRDALVSGKDGLDAIRHIIKNSPHWLKPQGFLLLEHGYDQKQAIQQIFKSHGFTQIHTWQDIAQQDRVSIGQMP